MTGGYVRNGYRYVFIPGHVLADPHGHVAVHRLVAHTKIRPLKPKEVVHHINGDPLDNRPENLEILRGHSEHKRLHDPAETGIPTKGAKLTISEVRRIRSLKDHGVQSKFLAGLFGVSREQIDRIVRGSSWAWVQ